MEAQRPLGILDSGVGGLSVLRHVRAELPHENLLYYADQAHVPYGPRPAAEIRAFTETITHFLLEQGAKLIIVACNVASAAALTHLRATFPETPFVGMEPAVKPGAAVTRSGKVGVLATLGTLSSQRYQDLMARYAQGVQVMADPCPGLVELIEAGRVDTPETERLLRSRLEPMLAAGVDTLILGCTHYPFVIPLIQRVAGPGVTIIDPAPAVARQTRRVLAEGDLWTTSAAPGRLRLYTSGDPGRLADLAGRFLPDLPQPLLISQKCFT
ncbi:MAG: glutamate racemase [Chloroflexota bacterium]